MPGNGGSKPSCSIACKSSSRIKLHCWTIVFLLLYHKIMNQVRFEMEFLFRLPTIRMYNCIKMATWMTLDWMTLCANRKYYFDLYLDQIQYEPLYIVNYFRHCPQSIDLNTHRMMSPISKTTTYREHCVFDQLRNWFHLNWSSLQQTQLHQDCVETQGPDSLHLRTRCVPNREANCFGLHHKARSTFQPYHRRKHRFPLRTLY